MESLFTLLHKTNYLCTLKKFASITILFFFFFFLINSFMLRINYFTELCTCQNIVGNDMHLPTQWLHKRDARMMCPARARPQAMQARIYSGGEIRCPPRTCNSPPDLIKLINHPINMYIYQNLISSK